MGNKNKVQLLFEKSYQRHSTLFDRYNRQMESDVTVGSLYQDSDYMPLYEKVSAKVKISRYKFLKLICNGGKPAEAVWKPLSETCEYYNTG